MSRETTIRRRSSETTNRETTRRETKANDYGKPEQEIVDEKTSRRSCSCSCHSNSRIDVRVLFGAEQAGNSGEASTEGAGGNHRQQRLL
jgi:hypothetical protein